MSDPARWADGAPDAPRGARDVLARAPAAPAFDPATRARVLARVVRTTSGGAAAGAAGARWLWWTVGGVAGLATAMVVTLTGPSRSAPRHGARATVGARADSADGRVASPPRVARSQNTAPVATAPARAALDDRDGGAGDPPQSARVAPPTARARSGVGAVATTPAEAALLEQARRAAVGGDPAAALDLTRRHAREFPRSQLAEEREFIAVQALLRVGRRDEARARGAALLRRAPRGIFADSVRRLVGGAP